MKTEDISRAAALHRLVFPDYFLTHMGQRFLERFYSEFVDRSGNFGFVAACGEEPLGAVIGTLDSGRFFNQFYRRHFPGLALLLAGRFIVDPYIRRNLVSRLTHVRRAFSSVMARRRGTMTTADTSGAGPAPARLLSIGLHPAQRGSGLAERLVDHYCEALCQDGWEWVGLSVRPDNQRAIAFYEKTGWKRVAASPTAVQYIRSTAPRLTGKGCP